MFGAASPILKTIMEAGAAYPLLREMMQFTHADTDKFADLARTFLTSLPAELKSIVENDPALAEKIAELSRRPPAADIDVELQPSDPPGVSG